MLMNCRDKKKAFYVIMWLFIAGSFCFGVLSHGATISTLLHNFPNDTYMDLFNSMQYGNQPYENQVIYPPLANCIYGIMAQFIPKDQLMEPPFIFRDTQMGRMVLGIYIILTTVLFLYAVQKLYRGSVEEQFLLCLTLLLSAPSLYVLERGNLIFVSMSCILFYLYGYGSKKTYVRHLAFISLAIATAIKIYPAILGLLLVREKRWKDVFVCILWGMAIFLIPFAFVGGIKELPVMVANILNCGKDMALNGFGHKVNITNTFGWIGDLLGQERVFDLLGNLLAISSVVLAIVITLFGDFKGAKWKIVAVPSLAMITFPGFSFVYSLIFVVPSLLLFLTEDDKCRTDWIYLILYILVLIPIVNFEMTFLSKFETDYYILTLSTVIQSVSILCFQILLYFEGVCSVVEGLKTHNKTKKLQVSSENSMHI